MDVIPLYCEVARLVLRPDQKHSTQDLQELSYKLPELRKALSCVVCRNLVIDPYKPNTGTCQHNVCRLCVRGLKELDPKCSNCQNRNDFKTYRENRYLSRILLCYKSVCVNMKRAGIFPMLASYRAKYPKMNPNVPTIKLPNMTLQAIILEGSKYDDMMSKFVEDLPHPSFMPTYQNNHYPMEEQSTLLSDDTTFFDMDGEGAELHEAIRNDDDQHEQQIEYEMDQDPEVNTTFIPSSQTETFHMEMESATMESTTIETTMDTTTMDTTTMDTTTMESITSMEAATMETTTMETATTTTSTLLLPGAVIEMPPETQLGQIIPEVQTESTISVRTSGIARVAPSSHNIDESESIANELKTPPKSLPYIKRRLRIGGVEQIVHKPIKTAQAQPLSTATSTVTSSPSVVTTTSASPQTTTVASPTPQRTPKRKLVSESESDAAGDCNHNTSADSSDTQPRKKKFVSEDLNGLDQPETTSNTLKSGASSKSANQKKKASCRCGQLKRSHVTCFRQRCPCYRNGLACNSNCKCAGCHNPRNKEQQPPAPESTATVQPLNTTNTNNNQEQFVNLMPGAQHPPVLIQHENGGYQVVNLYSKTGEPVNPATLGLPRIQLQTVVDDVNSTITAYVMTSETKVVPVPPVQSVQPMQNVDNSGITNLQDAQQQTDEDEHQDQDLPMQTRSSKNVNVICMDHFDEEQMLANVTSDL